MKKATGLRKVGQAGHRIQCAIKDVGYKEINSPKTLFLLVKVGMVLQRTGQQTPGAGPPTAVQLSRPPV